MLQSYQQQQGVPCVHEESMLATGALAIAIGDKSGERIQRQSTHAGKPRVEYPEYQTPSDPNADEQLGRLCTVGHSPGRGASRTLAPCLLTDRRTSLRTDLPPSYSY